MKTSLFSDSSADSPAGNLPAPCDSQNELQAISAAHVFHVRETLDQALEYAASHPGRIDTVSFRTQTTFFFKLLDERTAHEELPDNMQILKGPWEGKMYAAVRQESTIDVKIADS